MQNGKKEAPCDELIWREDEVAYFKVQKARNGYFFSIGNPNLSVVATTLPNHRAIASDTEKVVELVRQFLNDFFKEEKTVAKSQNAPK